MSNNFLSNIKFNNDGNQIIEEKFDGSGKIEVIKFGYIRLMNEKNERRVSLKTLLDINKAQNANFTGKINIPEINMSVYASQIVMTRSDTENIRIANNFTNLPTETIMLDKDFHILNKNRIAIEREYDEYYIATCHFIKNGEEKQYYMNKDQIKRLVLMKKDLENIGYPHFVAKTWQYGI